MTESGDPIRLDLDCDSCKSTLSLADGIGADRAAIELERVNPDHFVFRLISENPDYSQDWSSEVPSLGGVAATGGSSSDSAAGLTG